jgi:carbon storage regulator
MLVVSRKPGERLLIGESVEVVVLAVRGDQVSLGVSAPRAVPIHRQELLERIRRENQRAAALGADQLEHMGACLRAQFASQETATTGASSPANPAPHDSPTVKGAA